MKYLLDTCVISDFVKGEKNTLNRVKSISPAKIAVSSITIMEIQYGLLLNPGRMEILKSIIQDFLRTISILNFSPQDAEKAATLRAALKQRGLPIGSYDLLLAGTALNHQLIFVSSNIKEFRRIDGLTLENWRESISTIAQIA